MSDAWQLAESFERTRRLIAAINTLSIHNKLILAGRDDRGRDSAVSASRKLLSNFLQRLAQDLPQLEDDLNTTITGTSARTNLLARQFVIAKSQTSNSPLFDLPVSVFAKLLDSADTQDRRKLIEGLTTLRTLLEQHHHADSVGMLGDL